MSTSESRPARRDSVRNRQLLVDAAREVFAERGFEATLDDVARHAGLGTGTAYRHFPNKHALAAEVLRGATEQIVTDAHEALDVADPWAALVQFFERVAERQASDRGLYETLTGQGDREAQAEIWPRIVAAVRRLFDRAQKAGAVRPDAVAEDVAAVFALLGPAYAMGRSVHPEVWRRYLILLLDGLRAEGRRPLPEPAPTAADIPALLGTGKQF
ncbi:helix-turn-helix domain-containing protein [Microbacterium sp.]|uniref:TetR/AcrR family transcriptional regulator n=1 Tax=Microbacterium sp. TaxID=51671 RepID=UPI003221560F